MWKRRANALLAATTGYQLQRARLDAQRPTSDTSPEPSAATTAPSQPEPATTSRPRRGTRRGALPARYDDAAKQIIRRVNPRTMTSPEKIFGLILAVRYVVANKIPGDVVECGVWRGGSMQAVALTLLECGMTDRDLHLFDIFAGMPPPSDKDRRYDGQPAADLLATSDERSNLWAVAGLDDVRGGMTEVGYPTERIHYHEGRVEDTVPEQAPERIAVLRLDTDWYESTRWELEHLYPRLSPGGVVIIDDYGHWRGSQQATDEFLANTGEPLLLLPLASGRIAVKPTPLVGR